MSKKTKTKIYGKYILTNTADKIWTFNRSASKGTIFVTAYHFASNKYPLCQPFIEERVFNLSDKDKRNYLSLPWQIIRDNPKLFEPIGQPVGEIDNNKKIIIFGHLWPWAKTHPL